MDTRDAGTAAQLQLRSCGEPTWAMLCSHTQCSREDAEATHRRRARAKSHRLTFVQHTSMKVLPQVFSHALVFDTSAVSSCCAVLSATREVAHH